ALWLHQRDEAQKREKSHAERMRSLELGLPLPDAQVARSAALGRIGIAVPLATLAAAVTATQLLLPLRDSSAFAWVLATVWVVCGIVGIVALQATIARLRGAAGPQGAAVRDPTQPAGSSCGARLGRAPGFAE